MTTTKTKPRQPKQERPTKPLPVEIPPAPTAELDDAESENESEDADQPPLPEADPASNDATDATPHEPTSAEAHLDKIKAARAIVADRERVYLSKKSQAKQAKEAFEEAVADLTAVIDDGEEYLPLFDGDAESKTGLKKGEIALVGVRDDSPDGAPVNDAWRSVSVDQLGLSGKINDKLIEAGCGTIGELEDRRASHKGLKSISGIGDKKITIIEDAILKWLTENRDKEVFDRSTDAADGPSNAHTNAHVEQVHARAAELDNGEPDGLQQKLAGKLYWSDGKKAYNAGEPIESCIWTAGEEQDDWIRGWLFAAPVEKSPADK